MENIAKIVLDGKTGRKIGYILDMAIDFVKMQRIGYYIVDEETESVFLLKNDDIFSLADFVVLKDEADLEFVSSYESLIGKFVVDEDGIDFGVISEISFDKNSIKKIITTKCEILAKNIKSVGADVIFVSFKRRTKQKTGKEVFKNLNEKDFVVKIQNMPEVPDILRLSTKYYVGKESKEDILGYNNERIVCKGEKITKNTVEKAKLHNKLNQLFFAIKREK